MKKSTEERLAAIESGISRLTNMQGCMFKVLLLLNKISSLVNKSERVVSLNEVDLGSIYHSVNYVVAFMFGALALLGVSVALFSLYITTQDFTFRVMGLTVGIIGFGTGSYAGIMNHRAGKEIRETKERLAQTRERLAGLEKDVTSLDKALAQALTEWEELFPDESIRELRKRTTKSSDLHDRN